MPPTFPFTGHKQTFILPNRDIIIMNEKEFKSKVEELISLVSRENEIEEGFSKVDVIMEVLKGKWEDGKWEVEDE